MWKRGLRRKTPRTEDETSLSSADTEISDPSLLSETSASQAVEGVSTPAEPDRLSPLPLDLKKGETMKESGNQGTHTPDEHGRSSAEPDTQAKTDGAPKSSIMRAPPDAPSPGQVFGASSNGYGYSLLTAATGESSRETPEDLTVKDEDDDDDGDDDSDKLPDNAPGVDPERLKAFNMFVRLFVDENLDRMVPISKQPKEKIQAIIEACYRQFPEFHERARKRIRTYLKSCRRMKRQRDQNGLDSTLRPTPPHLTSARAEHILAAACESESENAKRLRMELMQAGHTVTTSESVRVEPQQHTPTQPQTTPTPTPRTSYEEPPAKLAPRTIDYRFTNGVGTHDPYYASIAPHHTANVLQATQQHAQLTNGPTDLSVKKMTSKTQLSQTEVANIRQLITSYRESAAFLYRSADELEQMLLQLN
ncbi:nucleolar protein 4-like [Diadema setosum]|uniref:nucleolar protein 4-like n=1 Tax=Diadema setosum TaxID=31175 RepID=UPI003B3AF52C